MKRFKRIVELEETFEARLAQHHRAMLSLPPAILDFKQQQLRLQGLSGSFPAGQTRSRSFQLLLSVSPNDIKFDKTLLDESSNPNRIVLSQTQCYESCFLPGFSVLRINTRTIHVTSTFTFAFT